MRESISPLTRASSWRGTSLSRDNFTLPDTFKRLKILRQAYT